ncbi:MAG: hypothetical protein H0W44_05490 [Gammaproteobacteria bacterium]|nr:hypothetical protein [Gammaproteobacteria bacterium]
MTRATTKKNSLTSSNLTPPLQIPTLTDLVRAGSEITHAGLLRPEEVAQLVNDALMTDLDQALEAVIRKRLKQQVDAMLPELIADIRKLLNERLPDLKADKHSS